MPNRINERADLRRRLEAGQSIQLFAPRRVGKTWLLRALKKDLEAEGWAVALVDVEGMTTTREVLRALCAKLEATGGFWEQAKGQFMHRLSRVVSGDWRDKTPLQAVGAVEPDAFAEELVATLDAQDRDTAILVDEIALFVLELVRADPHAARAFLYQLRRLQQAYPRVRWVLTGSIGLDVVARRLDLQGALVDMRVVGLEPFDDRAARSYLDALSAERRVTQPFALDDEGFGRLRAELGWLSPYYLELVADAIRPTGPLHRSGLLLATSADVDRAFEALLRPDRTTHFAPWREHLRKNFPAADADRLRAILDACCETPEGHVAATLQARLEAHAPITPASLKSLFADLASDGVLEKAGERWRFRSGLVRRYWKEYEV